MIRRIAAAIAASCMAVAASVAMASAASNINGPYDTAIITATTGPIPVLAFGATPGYYVGLSSVGGPQTSVVIVYDSLGVCSGTQIFNGTPGNSQEIQKLWPGRQVRLGITVCPQGAIVGSLEIYSR